MIFSEHCVIYVIMIFSEHCVIYVIMIFSEHCVIYLQVLYKASEVDSQLELKEKHYDKVNRLKIIVSDPKILQNNLTLIFSDQTEDVVLGLC